MLTANSFYACLDIILLVISILILRTLPRIAIDGHQPFVITLRKVLRRRISLPATHTGHLAGLGTLACLSMGPRMCCLPMCLFYKARF
jgi:hypothetical protein